MDAQTATLLCLGCPAGTMFGIDTMQWKLGPKFCGLRNIPAGLHFVYHSAGHDARSGEFVHVAGGEVLVRRWDEAVETFAPGCGMSAEEAEAAVATVRAGHYDAGLGPYPPGGVAAQWRQLCGHVTSRTLARAGVPVGTRVVPGDAEETAAPGAPQDQLAPFFEGVARAPRFSPVAARRLTGMTAAEVTTYNLSPGVRLARLLAEEYGGQPDELLGEYELAFVLFLLLSSLSALEHWKAALHLVSVCDASEPEWTHLALGLVSALTQQLALTPEDMFHDAMTSDNFLAPALSALARSATAAGAPSALHAAGLQLRQYAQSRFALSLSPSSSASSLEDEPVVVTDDTAERTSPSADAMGEADAAGVPPREADVAAAEGEPLRMTWMLPAPEAQSGGGA